MKSLLLVGCGKMGSAMLARWQSSPDFSNVAWHVIEPSGGVAAKNTSQYPDLGSLPPAVMPDVVVFAIKPQGFEDILPLYQQRFGDKPLYISIAAGRTLGSISVHFGDNAQVVRAMPNTPALVGAGMTVLCASPAISAESKDTASKLMAAVGEVSWVDKEPLMDAVTAVSGSGPAYIFLFLESLTEAGIEAGLTPEMARMLAIQTMSGSCRLAAQSGQPFSTLREQVTSPGGTTEAALAILMKDDRFKNLIKDAANRAAERSCELSK